MLKSNLTSNPSIHDGPRGGKDTDPDSGGTNLVDFQNREKKLVFLKKYSGFDKTTLVRAMKKDISSKHGGN